MDKTTASVICFGLLAIVTIVCFLLFRRNAEGEIEGPFGIKWKFKGSNKPTSQPGVSLKDAEAKGNIRANDATGKGASAEKLKAGGDIEISSSPPPKQ